MLDPFRLQVSLKLLRYVLATTVSPKGPNALSTFVSSDDFKLFELLKYSRLLFMK